MATVVDALVVELGLDPKALRKGAQQVQTLFGNVTSGAGKMSAGVSKATDTAADSFRHLERNALAFFAVLTGGKALKAFVSDTTASNVAAGQLARNLGTSVNTLTTWQKVAEAAGGSASDMSSSLGSLVSQFQTIDGRRNLGMAFGQMGVRLEDAHGKLRDFNALLPDMARAAQRLGPQLFSTLAGQAGFSQGAINMLELGPKRIEALYKSLKQYEPTERDSRASGQLLADWTKLTAQSESFGRSIMTDLSPEVHHLMTLIGGVIDKNQGWLRQDIDQYVTRFGDAIEHVDWKGVGDELKRWWDYLKGIDWADIEKRVDGFATDADSAAKAVGGWAKAAEILFALWAGKKFMEVLANVRALSVASGAGLGTLSKLLAAAGAHEALKYLDPNDDLGTWIDKHIPGASALDNFASHFGLGRSYATQGAQKVLKGADPAAMIKFTNMAMASGWSKEQATGLLANAMTESSLNPMAVNGVAYGLMQWHPDRQAAYTKLYGHTMQSVHDKETAMREQMDFANWELTHTEKGAGDLLRQANNAGVAAAIVSNYFERPKDVSGEIAKRGALADYLASPNSVVGAALSNGPLTPSAAPQPSTGGDNLARYMDSMRASINAPTPSGSSGDTSNTITNNFNIHAPNNDPKAIAREARNAFDSVAFRARQANIRLT